MLTTGAATSDADLAARPVRPIGPEDAAAGVVGRFREVVRAQPDAVAVADEGGEVTFRELAGLAARVLASVRSAVATHPTPPPARPGEAPAAPPPGPEPVAVLHSHDAAAVAAILGVVASGHPVVVLDPRTPAPRLATFVERTGARIVVADAATATTALGLAERVVRTDTGPRDGDPAVLWADPPDPDAPAALAFTSGSTGAPKVVVNSHRMLVRDAWTNSTGTGCYGADDVVAHTLPMAFHAGLMATVAGLVVGTTMRLYDVRGRGIEGLPGFVAEFNATVMHASPAILRAFTGAGPDPAQLASLRSLTIAGETAHGRDVAAARVLLPGCTIRNRYGSSETGLIAECAIAPGEPTPEGPLPVGTGVGDTVLGLLREDGAPAAPGESGTVTVTASATASGYWGDPEATAAAFTTNPDGTRTYRTSDVGRFDEAGRLHLLGRRDHSVKIRGYLVEPGEVDAALFALDGVAEAVTVGVERPSDGQIRLVSYVVAAGERPAASDLRAALHGSLPGYMVPEQIVFLEQLPRTERGKLDRSRLPAVVNGAQTGAVDGFTEWERVVSLVWLKVLPVQHLGLDDDFFELGGDSLAAESLLQLMVAELGVPADEATTTLLVQAPTLGAFADRLQRKGDSASQTLIPLQPGGTRTPLFVVAGGGGLGLAFVPLSRHLGPDQPSYALQAHAMERRGLPDWTVAGAARRHVATIRTVQPEGPYQLAGHSFGGLIALEMAHQLRRAGQEVGLLVMLDSFPPDPSMHVDDRPAGRLAQVKEAIGIATTGVRHDGADYWRFYRQSQFLHRRYRTEPWPGNTLVVVGSSPEKAQRSAWQGHLTGEWELAEVSGDHLTMNREPQVQETAAAIAAALEKARRRAQGSSGSGAPA